MAGKYLKDLDHHFAFGANWASYAELIDAASIEEAERGLTKLIPAEEMAGRSFLDIGCGSGLHALAAARLGVAQLTAVDIDPQSVAVANGVLMRGAISIPWEARQCSVFDLDPARDGVFDIVYSWGVLHHTGAMWEAIAKAAAMVAPGGQFALALYRRTTMDFFWKVEKRLYAHAPAAVQTIVRALYVSAYGMARRVTGMGSLKACIANYRSSRGMDFYHDVHDWLGGYPYETASAPEVDTKLRALGFEPVRVFARPKALGIFGSGCDEYVYRRCRAR